MKENTDSLGEAASGEPLETPPSPTHRILIADDDIPILRLNVKLLSGSGYHVDAVEDGAAAWEAINAVKYDLLVTDNNMPKLTGMELVKRLHAARLTLPVIMVTGVPPEEELAQNPWLNTVTILLKPYSINALLEVVSRTLCSETASRERMSAFQN